jgi:ribosomal protein S18 acetylase RimI-like enzyme
MGAVAGMTNEIGVAGMITIRELDDQNMRDVNRCDGVFTVDSRLVLQVENDVIRYTVAGIPPYQKRYPHDEIDTTTYLADPAKTIFFAYVDGQLAGQVILRGNWNRYCHIEDIAVDIHFRRCGVGRALMEAAIAWAKGRDLAGLSLETQNNNVAACRFYERCGFRLGGFDRYLYRGVMNDTEEIALYWYFLF